MHWVGVSGLQILQPGAKSPHRIGAGTDNRFEVSIYVRLSETYIFLHPPVERKLTLVLFAWV